VLRRPILALALVSALTGCVAGPPPGPFVEYNPDLAPTTRRVTCPAVYILRHADRTDSEPLAVHRVAKGERIGFRREADFSVIAVAPGYTLALPPGAYVWDVDRTSLAPWWSRAAAELCVPTYLVTKHALLAIGAISAAAIALAICIFCLYARAIHSS
jgi:hypothetical protein